MTRIQATVSRLLPHAGWLAAAFLGGYICNGTRTVAAQSSNPDEIPMIQIRAVGGDSQVFVHYPKAGRMYVFNNAFSGAPKRACAYFFRVGNPGDPLRRELCPSDMSDR